MTVLVVKLFHFQVINNISLFPLLHTLVPAYYVFYIKILCSSVEGKWVIAWVDMYMY